MGKNELDCSGEVNVSRVVRLTLCGFGEIDTEIDYVDNEDVKSCAETQSSHAATCDDHHDIDHLAKRRNTFLEIK